jgi:hypothetical protein
LVVSVLLLLFACALAAEMTWLRSHEPLGDRMRPAGWGVSFRPPRGFKAYTPNGLSLPGIQQFLGATAQGAPVLLGVWHIEEPPSDEALPVAIGVLQEYTPLWLGESRMPQTTWASEAIGPLEGAEILSPEGATLVRAAVADESFAVAVTLNLRNGPIDPRLYELFDLTCRSIELAGP